MPLTRTDIEMYLGDVSDELVSRILAMGMTRADLAEVARHIERTVGDEDTLDDETVEELCRLVMHDDGEEIPAEEQRP